ncbi:MAG: phage endopeptidase [Anaerocolumna sp.]|nr:phage endopeptidase [Anaerocolumna sp.]
MITLYNSTETNFQHNGIGVLNECIRADISRELNGVWYLELEYPMYGGGKTIYKELQNYRIIKVPTPSGYQLFRIQKTEKEPHTIIVYAKHIVFDLMDNFVPDTNIVGKNRLQAVQQILNNTLNPHIFTASGDTTEPIDNARIVRKNPISAIFSDDDNSILTRWGGEFDFNNFNIIVKDEIGVNSGYIISYGKNLIGITETLDMDTLATRIVPQGADELLLPEYYIDSPLVSSYPQPIVRHMTFDSITVNENTTEATALQQLRDLVNLLYSEKHVDQPSFNYEIEFEHLGNTREYEQFKNLISLNLGDKVKIRHLKMNIDLDGRIISYEYDCILKKYKKIVLGIIKKDINIVMNKTLAQIEFTKQKIELSVSSLDARLTSKIELSEDQILQEVTNKTANLQSQITIQAGQISSKVSSGEVMSLIQQNPTDVKLYFNNISPKVMISQAGLVVMDPSGNVTINNGEIIAKKLYATDGTVFLTIDNKFLKTAYNKVVIYDDGTPTFGGLILCERLSCNQDLSAADISCNSISCISPPWASTYHTHSQYADKTTVNNEFNSVGIQFNGVYSMISDLQSRVTALGG